MRVKRDRKRDFQSEKKREVPGRQNLRVKTKRDRDIEKRDRGRQTLRVKTNREREIKRER